jgi:cytochrome c-type biogenesis protein CcmH
MITFILIALAMIAVAVLILLLPLRKEVHLNRGDQEDNLQILRDQVAQLEIDHQEGRIDQEQLLQAQREIEKRVLLEESAIRADLPPESAPVRRKVWGTVAAVGVGVPVLSIVFYILVGNPFVIEGFSAPPQQPAMTQQDIENMVKRLEDRLKANPNDPEGWRMLSRSYATMDRMPEATQAYAKALALAPNDPVMMIDYADLLAFQNQSAQGEPLRLTLKALEMLPDSIKGLALAGTAFYEAGNFKEAQRYWGRALALADPGSPLANAMSENIQAAKDAAAAKK